MAVVTTNTTSNEQHVQLAGLGRALVQHRMLRVDEAASIQKKADEEIGERRVGKEC